MNQERLDQRAKLSSKCRWGIKDSLWSQNQGGSSEDISDALWRCTSRFVPVAHGDAICYIKKGKSPRTAKSQYGFHITRLQEARWLLKEFCLSLRICKDSCVLVVVDLPKLGKLWSLHEAIPSSLSPNSLSCDSVIYLPMLKSHFLSRSAELDFFIFQHEIYCLSQKHSANNNEPKIYRCFPVPAANVFSHYPNKIYYNSTSLMSLRKGI